VCVVWNILQGVRKIGVQYSVLNLLGAFTDPSVPAEKKDSLLETLFTRMEVP
jgi:hypothetical protein